MRLWYLSHRRPAKAEVNLRIRTVSLETLLFGIQQSMEVDEGFHQKSDIQLHWMAGHACLKNEGRKYHNLMRWLKYCSYTQKTSLCVFILISSLHITKTQVQIQNVQIQIKVHSRTKDQQILISILITQEIRLYDHVKPFNSKGVLMMYVNSRGLIQQHQIQTQYRNDPKFSDTQKICCNHSKV